jgi:hypothetical protein
VEWFIKKHPGHHEGSHFIQALLDEMLALQDELANCKDTLYECEEANAYGNNN